MSGRALLTGASGFVGANVARALLAHGREVRALLRPSSDRRNLPTRAEGGDGLEVWEADLRDRERVLGAVKGCDEVFHVAADYRYWARDYDALRASNVEGTRNLLDGAVAAGVRRFVHTSTVGTIGLSAQPSPCDEETPHGEARPPSHYKRSKLEAEALVLDYARRGLPAVVVNPSTPLGPFDRKPTPTGKVVVDFLTGRLPAYVKTGLNFVHVRDVAEGHLLAAERGRVGARYILGNANLSMREFLELLARIAGRRAPRLRIPYALAFAVGCASTAAASVSRGEPRVPLEAVRTSRRFMFFDSSKAVRELGLPQTPVETAAREAVEWFQSNGYAP
jgi:dihydroflavonol-4-reductase